MVNEKDKIEMNFQLIASLFMKYPESQTEVPQIYKAWVDAFAEYNACLIRLGSPIGDKGFADPYMLMDLKGKFATIYDISKAVVLSKLPGALKGPKPISLIIAIISEQISDYSIILLNIAGVP